MQIERESLDVILDVHNVTLTKSESRYITPDPVGSAIVETHPTGKRVTYEDSTL